jgi:hypothetical protein
MDSLRRFLRTLREQGVLPGRFRGLLHVLIGRRITQTDGTLVSAGLAWRAVAELLRSMRWDREAVRELGLDPADLPPRDRQRYWFTAIKQANVDGELARAQAEELVTLAGPLGYEIGPPP